MKKLPALVVFSHLRWNFVWQRPQHLLSKLASSWRVLFIEEPLLEEGAAPHLDCQEVAPNVTVCVPRTSLGQYGFCDEQNAVLKPLIERLLTEQAVDDYVLWFYSPM